MLPYKFIPTTVGLLIHVSFFVSSAGGEYIGCFHLDLNITEPDMIWKQNGIGMTVSMCADICKDNAYENYGLQNESQCYCGNQTETLEPSKVPCNTPCQGEPKCGGNDVIDMYNNASTYIGCFNYTIDDTIYFGGRLSPLTRRSCLARCRFYQYFGLTEGSKCYCRSEIANITKNDDVDCKENRLPCQGGEACGGYGMIDVWNYTEETDSKENNDSITTTSKVIPSTDVASITEGPTDDSGWLTTELADGITWLAIILLISSFILGCLTVTGILCILRTYRSRKLVMEVRRRLQDAENRKKMNEKDKSNYSSIEDLTENKQGHNSIQKAKKEPSSGLSGSMPNSDPQYAKVNRKCKSMMAMSSKPTLKCDYDDDALQINTPDSDSDQNDDDSDNEYNLITREPTSQTPLSPPYPLVSESIDMNTVINRESSVNEELITKRQSCPVATREDETEIITSFKRTVFDTKANKNHDDQGRQYQETTFPSVTTEQEISEIPSLQGAADGVEYTYVVETKTTSQNQFNETSL